jgi:hypothetical protein
MMKTLSTMAACAAVLVLSACGAHVHSLMPEESDPALGVGWFSHEGPEPPEMDIEFEGKRFEARGFAIEKTQNLKELRRRYGTNRRHWDRIFSGQDTDHLTRSAEADLRAADGAQMRCAVAWRGALTPAGTCFTADGTRLPVRFE